MAKRTHIKIGPVTIPVRRTGLDDENIGEFIAYPSPQINVDRNLTPQAEAMVLLHESIHAIGKMYGINLTEQSVRTLEITLTQWIVDHPDIVRKLRAK